MTARRVVDRQALERAADRATRDSARLEGRDVPVGFVRSARVERFLAERVHRH